MPGCSVAACHNWNGATKNQNLKYFQFPKDEAIRQKWVDACNSDKEINLQNGRICSLHFTPDCFLDTSHLSIPGKKPVLKLLSNAIPSINLKTDSNSSFSGKEKRGRKRKCESKREIGTQIKRIPTSTNSFSSSIDKSSSILSNITKTEYSRANTSSLSSILEESREMKSEIPVSDNAVRQTNFQDIDTSRTQNLLAEVERLRLKNIELQEQYQQLKLKNEELEAESKLKDAQLNQHVHSLQSQIRDKVYEILSPIFTPGQIQKLLYPKQKCMKWSKEDIASAIALRSVTPNGYRYLLKNGHPLPSFSTLRKRAVKYNIQEGINIT